MRQAGGDPSALSPLGRSSLVGGRVNGARPETFRPGNLIGLDVDAMARDAAAVLESDDLAPAAGTPGPVARPQAATLASPDCGGWV